MTSLEGNNRLQIEHRKMRLDSTLTNLTLDEEEANLVKLG